MKKIFYLETCSTCHRIMNELNVDDSWETYEIKSNGISEKALTEMRKLTDSYESLFSRRAMKFREWDLQDKNLSEDDYKDLILKEYTFLKRPVIMLDDEIFIGSAKKTVETVKERL